ncbi:amidohydrolase family protein [Thermococcus sibiricus]|uniref:5-methylthioadenosine/S-adenosylhomocysteine deaminase n=1 Tax=Thermococcus sibiricus (strain DSM 12597 / MM 739) TaxID=604354 RepID=MTAD_THESM|nr:amidohydrolase family protein [Thermococcus sibiricus]C6A048.1 RecName: Full=5-methylthioadenosine/S-adenosylhomocysteine deaminase; Short=MTA/SAH deaminase [Thermococcus sibiricus MM 739]ACS91029.1 5-methylthioadenosine/S-adenosylhomocysteine deaminase [Thermococcus sibiricus MM 739]
MSILIKNGYVIYGDSLKIIKADIYIENNKISKIGKDLTKSADHVIDAKGRVISPGFINAHTHSPMVLLRGLADDISLMEWLQNYVWPVEKKLKRVHIYWGALLGTLEMIKTGTTTFVDMYFHMEEVAKAVEEIGLRAYLSYGMVDLGDEEKRSIEIRETLKLLKFIESLSSPRVEFLFGPHAPYTCSPKLLTWVREKADETGKMITIHLSETKDEVKQIKEKYGKTPVELLDELGFLKNDVIAAHGVWLTDKEIEILAKRDVTIVHNPASNMKLGSGVMSLEKLLKAGVNVALGTDGAASNNNLDMIEEMKLAALLHKVHTLNPTLADAKTVFKMATQNGAKALRLNAGVIKEGALADVIVIDFNKPHLRPITNIISHIVYSANGNDVETTIVDGKVVMLDREVLTIDEEKILDKVQKIVDKLR